MSFLQKAKERAGDLARDAAEASGRAAASVSAKAQDPETQERVKEGLASAGRTTGVVAKEAAGASAKAAGAVVAKVQDPATQAKVKGGMASAGRGARTMVERIDPGILADVIIKATALQERANARLRRKGSIYRIGELQVTASLPPGISFSIVRIGEADGDDADAGVGRRPQASTEILAADAAGPQDAGTDPVSGIISLDGEEQAAIAFGIAETAASMDAVVDAIETGSPTGPPDVDGPEPTRPDPAP